LGPVVDYGIANAEYYVILWGSYYNQFSFLSFFILNNLVCSTEFQAVS